MTTRFCVRLGRTHPGQIYVIRIQDRRHGPTVTGHWIAPDWDTAFARIDAMLRDPDHNPAAPVPTTWFKIPGTTITAHITGLHIEEDQCPPTS